MKTDLPEGVSPSKLAENYKIAAAEYSSAHKKAVKLDAADRNKMWQAVGAKFPPYQILPYTNHVAYVKNNILASLYTVGKSAQLLPTSENDKDIVSHLNIALERIWDMLDVPWFQMQAGERAALLNLGITQVGWDNTVLNPSQDTFAKGECVLKNVDPLKFMRDPFAEDLDTAGYCMTWDYFHKSVILDNPNYKEEFEKLLETEKTSSTNSPETPSRLTDKVNPVARDKKGYYKIITHWVRVEDKIHEIHTVDNKHVLYVREDVQPSIFPFAELHCNLPAGDLLGTSEPAKIFANSLAYNIMNSTIQTSEYKNQRPPRFINKQSMLNVNSFTKHGNDADKAFLVAGDPSKAVHYHQFPQVTQTSVASMQMLQADIGLVTGVDGRYTGRDTGSVLTTGGINSMLDQVTLIDAPKVESYENYSKRLTKIILSNYLTHSATSRNYLVKDDKTNKYRTVEVPFPDVDPKAVFSYEMAISSELPKNKARVEAMANNIMQMQMQYKGAGIDVDLIQPEEWLQFQDLPMREYMLERMGIQRTTNYTELVSQTVNQYASLIEQGADPEQAIVATAESLRTQAMPQEEEPVEETMQLFA